MKSEEDLDNEQARAIVLVDHLSSETETAESGCGVRGCGCGFCVGRLH